MPPKIRIIDTNVIVSGLIGADLNSPPARVLDAMLDGDISYFMSDALLSEYSSVLRRSNLSRLHGRSDDEIDRLLGDPVANALWRESCASGDAPDPGDDHLWLCSSVIRRASLSRVTVFFSKTLQPVSP